MDPRHEILDVLTFLSEYYNTEPTESQARIYLTTLADLHPSALKDAAYAWVQQSPFFPKVSELRRLAERFVPVFDYKLVELYTLQESFYRDGVLEPSAWQSLSEHYSRVDRPNMAEYVKVKFARLEAVQQGKITPQVIDRYREWETHTCPTP